MKKEYKKPTIGLFPTRCHVSSLSEDAPEEIDGSRRSMIARVGLMATVGHLSLYGGGADSGFNGTSSRDINTWPSETAK